MLSNVTSSNKVAIISLTSSCISSCGTDNNSDNSNNNSDSDTSEIIFDNNSDNNSDNSDNSNDPNNSDNNPHTYFYMGMISGSIIGFNGMILLTLLGMAYYNKENITNFLKNPEEFK